MRAAAQFWTETWRLFERIVTTPIARRSVGTVTGQILIACLSEIITRPYKSIISLHSMNSALGHGKIGVTEKEIEQSHTKKLVWRDGEEGRLSSTVALIHITTNKSHVSLKTGFSAFNPLRVAHFSLSEEVSRRHNQGCTITTYKSVSYETCCKGNEAETVAASPPSQKKIKVGRDTFVLIFHHSIEKCLKSLTLYAEQVIVCQSADGYSAYFHFALGS